MGTIITILILGLLLTFGGQLLKGILNVFSLFGRIGGWIIGIILILFLLKTMVFTSIPESVTPSNNTEIGVNDGELLSADDGDSF
jgi:hypothetical protein|tara:strand:- start:4168 stop:4422 length:255 start_codon:yes stop_codon:yes gene_type:complete